MNLKRILFVVLVILLSSNCGPVIKVTKLSSGVLPPKAQNAPVKVYMTNAPGCPYEEIAIVNTSEGAFAGGMDTFVESMKVKARALGGDALILGKLGTQTTGYVAVAPNILAAAEGNTLTGVIIRFLQQDCID